MIRKKKRRLEDGSFVLVENDNDVIDVDKIPIKHKTPAPLIPPPKASCPISKTIRRPILPCYPIDEKNRSFQTQWYAQFDWLEYDEETDSCYCFPCNNFHVPIGQGQGSKQRLFVDTGFSNWHKALVPKKGLKGHNENTLHKEAHARWQESLKREKTGTRITDLVNNCDDHRACLESVFTVVKYISMNGLPFRGHREKNYN